MRWDLSVALLGSTLGAILGACTESGAFVCSGDDSCGSGGICEADGWCSFADEECNSGRRYGSESGAQSGQCVVSMDMGTSSGGVVTTGAHGETSSTDAPTSSPPSSGSTSGATSDAATGEDESSSGGGIDTCEPPKGCTAEMFCELVDPDWLSIGELRYGEGTLILDSAEDASNYLYSSEPFDLREATVTQRVAVLPPEFNGSWVGMRIIDTPHYQAESQFTNVRWTNGEVRALFGDAVEDDAINPPQFLDLVIRSGAGTTELGFATEDGRFSSLYEGPTPGYFESAWVWFELIDSDPESDVQTELEFVSICPG